MTRNRLGVKWAWIAVAGVSIAVGIGGASCGNDDEPGNPAPGAAGSGGSAGSGGTGGSAGSTGGTAGTGGSATGGAAGTGGSAVGDAATDSPIDAPSAAQKQAKATLAGRSGVNLSGTATFTQSGTNPVTLVVTLQLDPSDAATQHGIHIHEVANCGPDDGGATTAGPHWNPADAGHGYPDAATHHLGDVGNIAIAANGMGSLTLTSAAWSVGTGMGNDVVGHALVIHANTDDGTSGSPETGPGNSGTRIGCGVITLVGGGSDAGEAGSGDSSPASDTGLNVDTGVSVDTGLLPDVNLSDAASGD